MNAIEVKIELEKHANEQKRDFLPVFFKTGKGQYGEGDRFMGVVVPDIRLVAKIFKTLPFDEIALLLKSEYHECRMCALLILVEGFKKGSEEERTRIYHFYLSSTSRINNWDLVDLSAPQIVGGYLINRSREELYRLASSSLLWDQRIAMLATLTFIRNNEFTDTIRLAEMMLHHPHDLMHKAVGWMLREAGKRKKEVLVEFLEKHHKEMPRTMLRYSIEKLSEQERKYYMKR
ncbi:DNA alkylation repair protein [Bacteroides sedimenti]|uniref:DNA alkylation repair protein n=1 Tax=Bacteroides sedimenti TaxID=2136147 RepID=A0ABN6Z652_9BACE